MQDCFRLHPEVYGDELADEEEGQAPEEAVPEAADAQAAPKEDAAAPSTTAAVADGKVDVKPTAASEALPASSAEEAKPQSKDA
jgi:mitochondrial intermembrane space import and assembly protein 40